MTTLEKRKEHLIEYCEDILDTLHHMREALISLEEAHKLDNKNLWLWIRANIQTIDDLCETVIPVRIRMLKEREEK